MFTLLTRMRCWSGHDSLHRQVSETGYIFGAYTAVDWPKKPTAGSPPVNVPDPSGSSFLFSLVNAYDRPFRLSLLDASRAMRVGDTDGPMFGGEVEDADGKTVKFSNLLLMHLGKSASDAAGNCTNDHAHREAYQIDAWEDAPPAGFKLGQTTFAGKQYFAAAEIECYSL
jgi:hypothetical protein